MSKIKSQSVRQHVKSHMKKEGLDCPDCNLKFHSTSALLDHRKKNHDYVPKTGNYDYNDPPTLVKKDSSLNESGNLDDSVVGSSKGDTEESISNSPNTSIKQEKNSQNYFYQGYTKEDVHKFMEEFFVVTKIDDHYTANKAALQRRREREEDRLNGVRYRGRKSKACTRQVFECLKCNIKDIPYSQAFFHAKSHVNKNGIKCPDCEFYYNSESGMRAHRRQMHGWQAEVLYKEIDGEEFLNGLKPHILTGDDVRDAIEQLSLFAGPKKIFRAGTLYLTQTQMKFLDKWILLNPDVIQEKMKVAKFRCKICLKCCPHQNYIREHMFRHFDNYRPAAEMPKTGKKANNFSKQEKAVKIAVLNERLKQETKASKPAKTRRKIMFTDEKEEEEEALEQVKFIEETQEDEARVSTRQILDSDEEDDEDEFNDEFRPKKLMEKPMKRHRPNYVEDNSDDDFPYDKKLIKVDNSDDDDYDPFAEQAVM